VVCPLSHVPRIALDWRKHYYIYMPDSSYSSYPRLAIGALSVATHYNIRCFQRASLLALARERRADGWLRMHAGGELLVRYVMSAPTQPAEASELRDENTTHHDLVLLDVRNSEVTCAAKIFRWLALAEALVGAADLVGVIDDDTFLHTERMFADVRPHAAEPYLFYGQFSWAEAWDERRLRHLGYANHGDRILRAGAKYAGPAPSAAHLAPGATRNGPFPLANGFMMVLGAPLARIAGSSAGAATLVERLTRAEAAGRRPLYVGKCDPAGDSSLGYVVAHTLPPELPIKIVDVTSSARVHFWRMKATPNALRSSLVVMHHAEKWEEHFRYATCNATGQRGADRAPQMRCIPVIEHIVHATQTQQFGHLFRGGAQRRGKASSRGKAAGRSRLQGRRVEAVHIPPRKVREHPGHAYFASHFANWTWCETKGKFDTVPGLQLRDAPSFCGASEPAVLRGCRVGFASSGELRIAGATEQVGRNH